MARTFVNNFSTTLNGSITNVATSITVTDGSGLGTITSGDYIACTIDDNAGNREIVHVTARSGNNLTVTRGQEGTSGQAFASGINIEARVTAAAMSSAGTLRFISSQTASSSATLDFTGLTDYACVMFVLVNILPATDDVELWIRTSTDNGSTYDSGASDYGYGYIGRSGATTGAASSSTSSHIKCYADSAGLDVGNATGEGANGTIWLYAPREAAYIKLRGSLEFTNANGSTAVADFSGKRNTAADVDAIRFLFSSGNIASGTIYAYGISKT